MTSTRSGLLGALALALLAAPRPAAAQLAFDLVGNWSGQCTQTETSATFAGTASFTALGDSGVLVAWQTPAGLGCEAADPGGYPLFEGRKPTGFSAKGIRVKSKPVDPWGKVKIHTEGTTFIFKGKKACGGAGPKKYKGTAALAGDTITVEASGKVQGELAHLTCTFTRVPG